MLHREIIAVYSNIIQNTLIHWAGRKQTVLVLNLVVYKTTTDRYGIKNKFEVNTVIIHVRKKNLSITYDLKTLLTSFTG